MVQRTLDWHDELQAWLEPFLQQRLGHKARRRMLPLYITGLIGPGQRKSVQPMTERLSVAAYDQSHHFLTTGVWDAAHWKRNRWLKLTGSSGARMRSW